jgi:hypothetical protein
MVRLKAGVRSEILHLMSQENVELVRGWFQRWNRGERDFPTDELLHPGFQVISRLQNEPFRGRHGLRRWMEEIDEQFREQALSAPALHATGRGPRSRRAFGAGVKPPKSDTGKAAWRAAVRRELIPVRA